MSASRAPLLLACRMGWLGPHPAALLAERPWLACISGRACSMTYTRPPSRSSTGMDSQGFLAVCYAVAVVLVVALAGYGFAMGFILRRKIADTESFITARGQVGGRPLAPRAHPAPSPPACAPPAAGKTNRRPTSGAALQVGALRIGWSFFAGAVGAWVISGPANYATYAGLLGLFFYSFSSGLPFIMVAYAGDVIRVRARFEGTASCLGSGCIPRRRAPPNALRCAAPACGILAGAEMPPSSSCCCCCCCCCRVTGSRPPRRPLSVQARVPHVLSLTDFIGWRFGFVAKTYVILLVLFNMSIGERRAARPRPSPPPPPPQA